jgi:prepilin-type N-terminal cleavage/methylation domain-containing protein
MGLIERFKIKAPQAGFSIVEVVISIVILSFLMLSAGLMFTKGRGYIKGQGDRQVAIFLAEHRLEEISTLTFNQLRALDAVPGDSLVQDTTESPPNDAFPAGNPMDGTNGLPDYNYYQCQTVLEYADVTTNGSGFITNTCVDDSCSFIRARVTVSLTDVQDNTASRGYFGPVTLEGVISDWSG